MTLIELMVVIVILVTLVAGVLPLISPNNDARKIAEASRGLQTYFMQAQAEAARLGRPVGVGFRETQPGSGVAIEAFQMIVPQPFAGFDQNARVEMLYPEGYYGTQGIDPRGGTLFLDQFNGAPMYKLSFVRSPLTIHPSLGYSFYPPDNFPRQMLKIGDVINLEGNEFLIVDGENNLVDDEGYVYSERGELYCLWLNDFGQQPPEFRKAGDPTAQNKEDKYPKPGNVRAYRIFRQPASTNKFGPSAESAYQFPAGVAIDLQASGLESNEFVLFSTLDIPKESTAGTTSVQGVPTQPRSIAIMFSPDGGIESVWNNGVKLTGTTRAFFLIGRQENGIPRPADPAKPAPEDEFFDFYGQLGQTRQLTEDSVRESRARINWLNLDSRWMIINGADGRLTVNQNASFNPLDDNFEEEFREEFENLDREISSQERQNRGGPLEVRRQLLRQLQIEAAHHFVHGDAGEETEP